MSSKWQDKGPMTAMIVGAAAACCMAYYAYNKLNPKDPETKEPLTLVSNQSYRFHHVSQMKSKMK